MACLAIRSDKKEKKQEERREKREETNVVLRVSGKLHAHRYMLRLITLEFECGE